jgi:hypothetical protein
MPQNGVFRRLFLPARFNLAASFSRTEPSARAPTTSRTIRNRIFGTDFRVLTISSIKASSRRAFADFTVYPSTFTCRLHYHIHRLPDSLVDDASVSLNINFHHGRYSSDLLEMRASNVPIPVSFPRHVKPVDELFVAILGQAILIATGMVRSSQFGIFEQFCLSNLSFLDTAIFLPQSPFDVFQRRG